MTETTAASTRVPVSMQLIGGPTALLEIGGLRLLTDPAFDAPGPVPSGDRTLTKTTGPAVAAEERMGDVGDIVEAIAYLETAEFVTGEILHFDGGQSAGH
jgi:NAD(P)-dependent dehydrogenase (short-subunit alcohol dehydrogenase family)